MRRYTRKRLVSSSSSPIIFAPINPKEALLSVSAMVNKIAMQVFMTGLASFSPVKRLYLCGLFASAFR